MYLSKVYGDDWRIPNALFGHDWSLENHNDLFAKSPIQDNKTKILEKNKGAYWNSYYSSENFDKPNAPTQFAAFVQNEVAHSHVIEVGCGTGRDSFFFAQKGFQVVAFDSSQKAIEICKRIQEKIDMSGVEFRCKAVGKPGFSEAIGEIRSKILGNVVVYGRFLLHALSESEHEAFFSVMAARLNKGDQIALEFRTLQDMTGRKTTSLHYRRYIDPSQVLETARRLGFIVDYAVEGLGFAKRGEDDAYVARCILRLDRD